MVTAGLGRGDALRPSNFTMVMKHYAEIHPLWEQYLSEWAKSQTSYFKDVFLYSVPDYFLVENVDFKNNFTKVDG